MRATSRLRSYDAFSVLLIKEIGSHTFSHYYCMEAGQTLDDFREDLLAAISAAARFGVTPRSIVFPRNQANEEYLAVCSELGFRAYRGTQRSRIYRARDEDSERRPSLRLLRLLDAYVNISGHNCYQAEADSSGMVNVRASRFLRPVSGTLKVLESLRLMRILSEMTYAARHGMVYHLWWHPHNFGRLMPENLGVLTVILRHYAVLHDRYGFQSLNMEEMADRVLGRVASCKAL